MRIGGAARLAGVMGWPVRHSLSPRLHGHWFERHGIDGTYVPLPVAPDDLPLAFRALPRLGFLGWNVTIPHKETALWLVDAADPAAARVGAVNTVLVRPDRTLVGHNTDGAGFLAALRASVPLWRPATGPAVLLGTGGGARAVAFALLGAGVPAVRLVNRTVARAEALARDLVAAHPGAQAEPVPWEGRGAALAGAALLVQCTSLGMAGQPPLDLDLEGLPPGAVVADLVYAPLETNLLARARARGHATVDGLGMLLHQAVPGFAHWGGVVPEVDGPLRAELLEALAAR